MKRKQFEAKNWRWHVLVAGVFLTSMATGCQFKEIPAAENTSEETALEAAEDTSPPYHSDTLPEDCFFCGGGNGTLLPLYRGQKNLGVINLNSLALSPVTINRYDDSGRLIEKPDNSSSTNITNTGEDGFTLFISPNVNRGYAHGQVSFRRGEKLDMEKAADHLCSECLNRIMENCWHDNPLAVGVIDFSTDDIMLFDDTITAFTFGDYYVSCDKAESDDDERSEISLLIFYCPERYQD